jgi:hypothetical protein
VQSVFDINGVQSVKDHIVLSQKFCLRKIFIFVSGLG